LILGCGNSALSRDLADDGYHNVVSLDYSRVCIESMRRLHASSHPDLVWVEGDVRDLPFSDASFDLAIDKGTLDALIALGPGDNVWAPPEHVVESVRREIDEVTRVLSQDGVFLHLTFGQPHFRKHHIARPGWDLTCTEIGGSGFLQYYLYTLRRSR